MAPGKAQCGEPLPTEPYASAKPNQLRVWFGGDVEIMMMCLFLNLQAGHRARYFFFFHMFFKTQHEKMGGCWMLEISLKVSRSKSDDLPSTQALFKQPRTILIHIGGTGYHTDGFLMASWSVELLYGIGHAETIVLTTFLTPRELAPTRWTEDPHMLGLEGGSSHLDPAVGQIIDFWSWIVDAITNSTEFYRTCCVWAIYCTYFLSDHACNTLRCIYYNSFYNSIVWSCRQYSTRTS